MGAVAPTAGADGFLWKDARATVPPPTTAPTAKHAAWMTEAVGILKMLELLPLLALRAHSCTCGEMRVRDERDGLSEAYPRRARCLFTLAVLLHRGRSGQLERQFYFAACSAKPYRRCRFAV